MKKIYKALGSTKVSVWNKGKELKFSFSPLCEVEKEEEQKLLESSHLYGREFILFETEGKVEKMESIKEDEVEKAEVAEESKEEKSGLKVVAEVTTVQQAARYLCDKEGCTMKEVNNLNKVLSVAKEKGYSFPNVGKK